ncbi:FAD binding domain-containing protein [Hypoxylon crocopeplum]|nr:FAD binding domain-containing protein [Hypoxylon crocopeplum]
MGVFSGHVACCLMLLQNIVPIIALPYTDVPQYFMENPYTRRDLSVPEIQQELGKLLSNGSLIFGPSDPAWKNATERWNTYLKPDIEVVVEPAQESDISTIVKYCNQNSIDFLAYNRGHGSTTTLSSFKGMQIDLSQLSAVTIQPDGKSVWLQGGAWGRNVINTLWDQGYVTSTGSSGCPGVVGPALGGGHGRYEGLHGLISDNFINLNVVLADGSTVRVNKTSYSDLFWAMQGAGHNFGIVSSLQLNIYPKELDTWHYHNYVWSQDKLETVFGELNKFHNNGNTPVRMGVNFGQVSLMPSVNETEAVLAWSFAYAGPSADAEKLLKPFNDIEAISSESGDVPYPGILAAQGTDVGSPSCSDNPYGGSVAGLQTYNITTERRIYNTFVERAKSDPELFANARVYYEGYSMEAVRAVDPASTAFPQRDIFHIVFFSAVMQEGSEDQVHEWANEIRDLWNAGQPGRRPTTYLNYAIGDESLEALYGYEPWRLERLRGLKAKYDPHNRFRFYNPIVKE